MAVSSVGWAAVGCLAGGATDVADGATDFLSAIALAVLADSSASRMASNFGRGSSRILPESCPAPLPPAGSNRPFIPAAISKPLGGGVSHLPGFSRNVRLYLTNPLMAQVYVFVADPSVRDSVNVPARAPLSCCVIVSLNLTGP